MAHLHFNHWAILVSAVIQWLIGAVWYSPALFAKPWMAMVFVRREDAKSKTMIVGMIASLIGNLVTSLMVAHVVYWSGAQHAAAGAVIGFILWLGFIAAPLCASYIYESRPFKLFAINTGYWLVCLLVAGVLLAVWR